MTKKYEYYSTVPRTFVEDCSYSGTTVNREIQLRLQALLQEYAAMSHQEAQETIDKWKVLLNKYSPISPCMIKLIGHEDSLRARTVLKIPLNFRGSP